MFQRSGSQVGWGLLNAARTAFGGLAVNPTRGAQPLFCAPPKFINRGGSLEQWSWQRGYQVQTDGMRGTTVLCVRKDDRVIIIADGQVTMGSQIIKPNVRKVRRLGESVIAGFAGATADAFTLFDRLEQRLEEFPGQLSRAAVDLAKAWRTDKYLRRLDAVMVVADADVALTITGTGDVLEPHDGIIGIGSGGPYALAAARALIDIPGFTAEQIAQKAMKIASDVCIYTNSNFVMEEIQSSRLNKSSTTKDEGLLSSPESAESSSEGPLPPGLYPEGPGQGVIAGGRSDGGLLRHHQRQHRRLEGVLPDLQQRVQGCLEHVTVEERR